LPTHGPGYPLQSFLPAVKKYFRFYPLREPKPQSGFGQANWLGHI
jgi:hypothetical protein